MSQVFSGVKNVQKTNFGISRKTRDVQIGEEGKPPQVGIFSLGSGENVPL